MTSIILAAHGGITTHFHEDIGRGFLHRGIDQGHSDGTTYDLQIMAPADGLVTFSGPFGSYGNVLFITHADGWVSVLAHHARQLISKGDWVKQGQLVAVMGNTGTVYVHSHQELRDAGGNQVDPLLHLTSATVAGTTQTLLGDLMALDDTDKLWLNGMGASIVKQVLAQVGPNTWATPIVHSGATGPASEWLGNASDAIARLQASGVDINALAEAIAAKATATGVTAAQIVDELKARL
ncbi:M23 family metallopeptidase [Cryobacterium sp. PH31-AA6]|uniref:M23 family metallopeptidase n=1 Tax=Cryobacterium sp. PH31-AA6 TaxID=3046205 RepID=UPI0024B97A1B|nr:M23 family metallopeptidase [Cryobacterium sp. PH31-AA6]MDJ0323162.1 M23 family metallopeptidase [Cryobacterium sp. PH31-AA6]